MGTRQKMKKILIADDEPDVACVIHDMLKRSGYSASVVHSGREAYALLTSCRDVYGLLIIDYMMPDWDGVEAIEMIRALGTDIPVIMVSGYSSDQRPEIPHGVVFIEKPFNYEQFMLAVGSVLRRD